MQLSARALPTRHHVTEVTRVKLAARRASALHSKAHLQPCHSAHSDSNHSHPSITKSSPPPVVVAARVLEVLQAFLRLWLLQQQRQSTGSTSADTSAYSTSVQTLVADLGVLWVKLGQTLAMRPDVVGGDLSAALSGLQESAPPFPSATAAAIIQQELGAPPSELFASWSEHPVASASLGQVYQATLKGDDGRLVAVKVQRPDMLSQISLDLSILTQLLRLLRAAGRIKQDITLWASTLGEGLRQELDYVQEAHNLTRFAAAHSYLGFADTPDVIWELTTTRVLTTTWVEGQTPGQILRQLQSLNSTGSTGNSTSSPQATTSGTSHADHYQRQQLLQLVDLGISATLHQLVVTGCLHGDPHTGNLLLSRGKLVFLDFGLLVDVPPEASVAMMAALLHWSQADWLCLAGDMRQMGLLKPTTDLQELALDLQARFEQLYANTASPTTSSSVSQASPTSKAAAAATTTTPTQVEASAGSRLTSGGVVPQEADYSAAQPSFVATSASPTPQQQPSALLQKAGEIGFAEFAGVVAALALKYRFELPPYYTLVIRSLTTLEGFALMVDPAARYSIARTAVKVVARQLLYDRRPAAQALLQEVLVLQDAPVARSLPGPRRLNLQLLQELLQLTATDWQPLESPSAPTAKQLSSSSNSGPVVASATAGSMQQQQQSVNLVQLCQQFGLSSSTVAAQLSSPEAAAVRTLLAQQLVRRAFSPTTRTQPSNGTAASAAAASNGPQGMYGSKKRAGGSGGRLRWLTWVLSAGFSGVRLALQMLSLVTVLVVSRVVAVVRQHMRHVRTAFLRAM